MWLNHEKTAELNGFLISKGFFRHRCKLEQLTDQAVIGHLQETPGRNPDE